jgi:hypothetical protein
MSNETKKFEHPTLGWFTISARPSVRQILAYKGSVSAATGPTLYTRFWEGIKPMIDEWNCPAIPDYRTFSLDDSEDFEAAAVVIWAADMVAGHMIGLETVPKNS